MMPVLLKIVPETFRTVREELFLLGLLQEDTTEQQIIDALRREYSDAPEGIIERDVHKALENLRNIGAVE